MKQAALGTSLLATVALVSGLVLGCGGDEQSPPVATATAPATTESASGSPIVSCDESIGGARYSGTDVGDRFVLRVISVPTENRPEAARPSGKKGWPYFAELGLVVRTDVPPVEISVPEDWRERVAISWGSAAIAPALRVASCPSYGLPWNAFDGGLYLQARTGCVPLRFRVGGRSATVRFGFGTKCKPA